MIATTSEPFPLEQGNSVLQAVCFNSSPHLLPIIWKWIVNYSITSPQAYANTHNEDPLSTAVWFCVLKRDVVITWGSGVNTRTHEWWGATFHISTQTIRLILNAQYKLSYHPASITDRPKVICCDLVLDYTAACPSTQNQITDSGLAHNGW